jgi:PST family polysaccharide transporter
MNLIRTTFYTGTATIIRTISGFVLSKIVAMQVGPSGLAFFGQFQNFVSMLMQFASGAINAGVVKYTSEFRSDEEEKRKIFSTALKICVFASIPAILLLLFFAEYFSVLFLKSVEYSFVFRIFAFTLLLFVLNNLLMAILNGQQDIRRYTMVNISSSIVGLILTGLLVYFWSLKGALVALATNQSLMFFITLAMVLKSHWFKFSLFSGQFNKNYFKKFMKYTVMALTSALVVPTSQMYLRNYVGENMSWDQAGYWQGLLKISGAYLSLVTTTLGVYYLPKLSELKEKHELRREILYGFKMILPVVILFSSLVYIFRDFIIIILFTKDFMPMRDLFAVQLLGDCIKISSWLFSYLMLAKAMGKLFIFSEVFFCASFVFLSVFFLNTYGLVGLVYAYALNYTLYLFFNLFYFQDIFFNGDDI